MENIEKLVTLPRTKRVPFIADMLSSVQPIDKPQSDVFKIEFAPDGYKELPGAYGHSFGKGCPRQKG